MAAAFRGKRFLQEDPEAPVRHCGVAWHLCPRGDTAHLISGLAVTSSVTQEAVLGMLSDGKSKRSSKYPSVKCGNEGSGFILHPENSRLPAQTHPGLSTDAGLDLGGLFQP